MKRSINIIGAGRVGKVLGRLFADAQIFQIQQIYTTSTASNLEALNVIGAGHGITDLKHVIHADITLLLVPDDALIEVTSRLLELRLLSEASTVVIASGAKSSLDLHQALPALAGLKIGVASVHPVRSFASVALSLADFLGTICTIEGDVNAVSTIAPYYEKIGARLVGIEARQKMLYHAASVFASNYLVTLMDIAIQAYVAAGIPKSDAEAMAQSLSMKSLGNVFELGAEKALTGPIKRGDINTVQQQAQVVTSWHAVYGRVYEAFIPATTSLAQREKS